MNISKLYLCPACEKPLMSRMSPRCNRCGVMVPPELLYSQEERARIRAEEKACVERLRLENEAKRKAAEKSVQDSVLPMFFSHNPPTNET